MVDGRQLMLEEGVTNPSSLDDETECPTDHYDLKPGQSCYTCGGAV
jgi:hypothetical protein